MAINFTPELQEKINNNKWGDVFPYMGDNTIELIQLLNKANIESFKNWIDNISQMDARLLFNNIMWGFLKKTDCLYTGPFGSDRTKYNSEGFMLKSQGSDLIFAFNPKTRGWVLSNTDYENNERATWRSEGWDNFIHLIYENPLLSWFYGEDWKPEDCYIGDDDKYPILDNIEEEWKKI